MAARPQEIRVTLPKRGYCDANIKRLEKGSYRFPAAVDEAAHVEVRAADLIMLLAGVDLTSVRRSSAITARCPGAPPDTEQIPSNSSGKQRII